jgi:hypothetical protein
MTDEYATWAVFARVMADRSRSVSYEPPMYSNSHGTNSHVIQYSMFQIG